MSHQFQDFHPPESVIHEEFFFRKGDCVMINGKVHIIMARLPKDQKNSTTYNICDENLMNPQFGQLLQTARIIPIESIPEIIKKRAKNFI